MQLPKTEKGEYLYGKRDLFAALVALKLTISKSEFRRLVSELDAAFKKLQTYAKVLDDAIILKSIGFPSELERKTSSKIIKPPLRQQERLNRCYTGQKPI